jgi:hypothetical protein
MIIKETSIFTKIILDAMSDDNYRQLQEELIKKPDLGKIIKGSGGIRKVRWNMPGKGKRGGMRIIYYWITSEDQIYMLYAYPKAKQENLTPDQLSTLKKVVEEELHE